MSINNHLIIILEKTQALRARINQIDTLVGITDQQMKENELTPQEIALLEEHFDNLSDNLDPELDSDISGIEGVLGI